MINENFIPKESTQQNKFLEKYPEYDGRGIKIAIIDSVVDSSLPGLQKTTTGLPKIIECIGKPEIIVDTSTIVKKSENDFIIGLTDRKLKIPAKWKNPSDEWHLGSIKLKELFDFIVENNCIIITDDTKSYELEASLKEEIIDCIVWYDGQKWQGCFDISVLTKNTQLENMKILTNYNKDHEFAFLKDNDLIYCINILNNGNSVQIFTPHLYHGSQVAHIAAAYFPNGEPQNNGAAPGVQIASMYWKNLEDNLLKCIEMKVDIVNLSLTLGEFLLTKSVIELFKKMVEEHGIIITKSAANFGPFYSSIPDQNWKISDQFFIIGSVFTVEMKTAFKYKESRIYPSVYNMSSRGPLLSGARGIDFVGPGAAYTDISKWYPKYYCDTIGLQSNQIRCCGTSFAAPNVAGTIACLLTALKASSIQYTPAMIKMALANTAFIPEGSDRLAFGNGIIQINDAFEFIKKYANYLPMKFLIPKLMDKPEQTGILHIIQKDENNKYHYRFNLDSELERKWILKANFYKKCTGEKNNFFIHHDKIVTNNSFNIQINSAALQEGGINYAEIHGIDPANPSIGPLFHLPITIIYPASASYFKNKNISVKPNLTTHFFLKKPKSEFSKCCCIKVTLLNSKKERKNRLYLQYPQIKYKSISSIHIFKFKTKEEGPSSSFLFDVEQNDSEFFEICFYHHEKKFLELKTEISFTKSVI